MVRVSKTAKKPEHEIIEVRPTRKKATPSSRKAPPKAADAMAAFGGAKADVASAAGSMKAETAKFEMEPPTRRRAKAPAAKAGRELPSAYGETRIVLMVRDPRWLFAYWEIAVEDRMRFGLTQGGYSSSLALRVYDVTGIVFDGQNANSSFDIRINDYAVSWYIQTPQSNRLWVVDYGFYKENGNFVTVTRSNPAEAPRNGVAESPDWAGAPSESRAWERIHQVSVGERPNAQIGIGGSPMSSEAVAGRGGRGAPSSLETFGSSERLVS